MTQYDPINNFIEGLHKMAKDLNQNIDSVRAWMSIQHTHNEIFMDNIKDLNDRIKYLEDLIKQRDGK